MKAKKATGPDERDPKAEKSTNAVENLQHGTSAEDFSLKGLQQLQTSYSHFTPDEDPGAFGPCPSPPSGGSFYGPIPVCLTTWHQSGRCHHLSPGQNVLWFLQCFQDHLACTTRGQAGAFLFTLYTAGFCHRSLHCNLQKISVESAFDGFIRDRDNRAYRELFKDFVD